MASALTGAVVAALFVSICLIVGIPFALDPDNAKLQFGIALAVNALLLMSPFLYAVTRSARNAETVVDITVIFMQGGPIAVSLLLTLLLYAGLGFWLFVIAHILMVAVISVAWLGWSAMRGTARSLGARQALPANRREALNAALGDIESAIAALPPQSAGEAGKVIAAFREEVRLLTPMQTDRNPNLMSKLWTVVEEMRQSAAKQTGAKPLDEAVASMRSAVETLRRA